MLSLFI